MSAMTPAHAQSALDAAMTAEIEMADAGEVSAAEIARQERVS